MNTHIVVQSYNVMSISLVTDGFESCLDLLLCWPSSWDTSTHFPSMHSSPIMWLFFNFCRLNKYFLLEGPTFECPIKHSKSLTMTDPNPHHTFCYPRAIKELIREKETGVGNGSLHSVELKWRSWTPRSSKSCLNMSHQPLLLPEGKMYWNSHRRTEPIITFKVYFPLSLTNRWRLKSRRTCLYCVCIYIRFNGSSPL